MEELKDYILQIVKLQGDEFLKQIGYKTKPSAGTIKKDFLELITDYKPLFKEIVEHLTWEDYKTHYNGDYKIIKFRNKLYKMGCGNNFGYFQEVILTTKTIEVYEEKTI